ncbi:MAG: Rrf2 family transcriptional regulator [Acidobacteria bacterium]|nr:Rrf2 family transcriptional regulator [Acidobacteriota bacterium]
MKVSTKGRYGLQLMLELALQWGRGPVLVATIAQRQGLPPKYLHVLLGSLKAAGLLKVQRGPSGGCELSRAPSRIQVLEILEILEGRLDGEPDSGDGAGSQVVAALLARSQAASRALLAKCSLADLADQQQALEAGSAGYAI